MTAELTLLSRVAYRDQEVTGPRLRSLLALLASDLRAGCSTARLVEGLWPDEQPENPNKALQVLVSRVRAQLGSDVVASSPTGYRLSLGEDQVDTSAVLLTRRQVHSAPTPATTQLRSRTPRPASLGGKGPPAAGPCSTTPCSTTRCPRCARNGHRRTGRWCVPARLLCRGWAAVLRRSSR